MRVDLNVIGPKIALDVTNVRTLYLQSRPIAGGSTGVVEVRRAWASAFDSPSVAFSPAATITNDGSAILTIDVTDTAWVHLVVTTAESGGVLDITHHTQGRVEGRVERLVVNGDAVGVRGFVSTQGAFAVSLIAEPEGEAVAAGAFEMRRAVAAGLDAVAYSPAETLTIDRSTVQDLDTDDAGVLYAVCTTAQLGLGVDIYLYLRDAVHARI